MSDAVTIGVSLKAYFDYAQARRWIDGLVELAGHPAIVERAVRLFILPSFLHIPFAASRLEGTGVLVGAQDVSADAPGPFTGEIAAAEIAAAGGRLSAIGHAERRLRRGETDAIVADKTSRAIGSGLIPVICVGETVECVPEEAAATTVDQVRAALAKAPAGEVIIAYEPVWAIGAAKPAPEDHVRAVTDSIREAMLASSDRRRFSVIYGGAAGPGLFTRLDGTLDGLFLGRFAHDLENLAAVLDEAGACSR